MIDNNTNLFLLCVQYISAVVHYENTVSDPNGEAGVEYAEDNLKEWFERKAE